MENLGNLNDLAISDKGFVFDPITGSTFNTNVVGVCIINAMKAGKDQDGIVAAIQDQFEVMEADVVRDLDDFIFLMRENGILPEAFSLKGAR
jgi:Coenzyme PQQ synthesis protein D (PqqD)